MTLTFFVGMWDLFKVRIEITKAVGNFTEYLAASWLDQWGFSSEASTRFRTACMLAGCDLGRGFAAAGSHTWMSLAIAMPKLSLRQYDSAVKVRESEFEIGGDAHNTTDLYNSKY